MSKPASTTGAGLRDVVAAPSRICYIDGEKGILVYDGYNIHDLARYSTFEEVIFLLWNGRLPKRDELDKLNAELAASRALPAEIIALLKSFPKSAVPRRSQTRCLRRSSWEARTAKAMSVLLKRRIAVLAPPTTTKRAFSSFSW